MKMSGRHETTHWFVGTDEAERRPKEIQQNTEWRSKICEKKEASNVPIRNEEGAAELLGTDKAASSDRRWESETRRDVVEAWKEEAQ